MLISNNDISFAEILSSDQNPTPPPPPSSDAIEEVWGNLGAGNFWSLASYKSFIISMNQNITNLLQFPTMKIWPFFTSMHWPPSEAPDQNLRSLWQCLFRSPAVWMMSEWSCGKMAKDQQPFVCMSPNWKGTRLQSVWGCRFESCHALHNVYCNVQCTLQYTELYFGICFLLLQNLDVFFSKIVIFNLTMWW